ncbi:MAG: c-type cytochrome [Ichthyobacteriaceae bacterium]|nr:c-type cytochrome [Ichthyobacteriaceae bacterium]
MLRKILSAIVIASTLVACGNDANNKSEKVNKLSDTELKKIRTEAERYFAVLPEKAPNISNPTSKAKIDLGHALYFDNRLSKDETQSCNTCHDLKNYGVDSKAVSDGDDGKSKGTRNSPTTLNAAFHVAQFWDGRAKDVEAQAGMPITNPVEMNIPSKDFLVKRLSKVSFYKTMFADAYPNEKNPITYKNIENAIGAFERELITPSRFDKYLSGDENAISVKEKEGLKTYIDKGCLTCHSGSLVGASMLQKFPLTGDYSNYLNGKVDMGKYEETKNDIDKFMFKVPSLRNIEKTGPYMHNGSIAKLSDAVKIMGKAELNIDLTENEINEIVTFLSTLTGDFSEEYKNAPTVLTK